MMNAAINAVRSGNANPQELLGILQTSEACGLVLQNSSVLDKLSSVLPDAKRKPKFALILWGNVAPETRSSVDFPVYTFDEVCPTTAYEPRMHAFSTHGNLQLLMTVAGCRCKHCYSTLDASASEPILRSMEVASPTLPQVKPACAVHAHGQDVSASWQVERCEHICVARPCSHAGLHIRHHQCAQGCSSDPRQHSVPSRELPILPEGASCLIKHCQHSHDDDGRRAHVLLFR